MNTISQKMIEKIDGICPNCGTSNMVIELGDELFDRTIKCNACGRIIESPKCGSDNDIIINEQDMKIFTDTKKQLNTEAFVAFAFKRFKNGLYVSRYMEGEFDRKYLLHVIEGAIKFYHFVEKRREELENAVSGEEKDIHKTSEQDGSD